MVTYCPHCGKPLQAENAEICPNCGVRIRNPTGQDPCGCTAVIALVFILGGVFWIIASIQMGQSLPSTLVGFILIGGGIYFATKARGWL
jgi:hypothetical protein